MNAFTSRCRTPSLAGAAVAWTVAILLSGCTPSVNTDYGQRTGMAGGSVNGTKALGEMFRQAGHKVFSRDSLSPRVEQRADCIVWFPDDFEPPSPEVREWMENWLYSRSGRTLIYVGRDYDAGPAYWNSVASGAPPEQKALATQRAAELESHFTRSLQANTSTTDCGWFTFDPTDRPRQVTPLQGAPEWLEGIDPAKADIRLRGRIQPSEYAETLVESEGDAIVTWEDWDGSQSLVVANGSFVLNLPLVNHENRKLARRLVEQVGEPGQTVVFLESRLGGPPIRDEDPFLSFPTGLQIFGIWPANWILLHAVILGVFFCFSRTPIFGVPFELPREANSDFGKHIDAMADLLARSRNEAYARGRLLRYRQSIGQVG